jgi:hypothetical protein
MQINEVDSLTDFLYDVANKIVGNIGKSTDIEDIEFALRFKDAEKAKEIWIEWINAYKKFARYNFNEGKLSNIDKPLKIYWRKQPEIFAYINGKPIKNLSPIDGGFVLYARLLITAQKSN